MAATSTSSPVGMGLPLALRAVQVLPSTYTAPAALSLSMPSVTFASIPRRRSVLVGITRVPTRRRVSGRIRSRETMDSRRNISSWASGETPAAAAINAPTAPMVNQIETRAVVAISATSVTTATPPQSQSIFIGKPPFAASRQEAESVPGRDAGPLLLVYLI